MASSRPAAASPRPQADPLQARPARARPAESRPAEAWPAEAWPAESRSAKVRPAAARRAESRSAKVRSAKARRAGYPAVIALAGLAVVGCGSATAGAPGSGTNGSATNGSATNGSATNGSGTNGSGTSAAGTSGSGSGAGQAASGRSLPAGSALCARPGQARRVVIVRTGGVRTLEGQKGAEPNGTLPPVAGSRPVLIRAITNRGEVTGLARALCALPRMPRGPLPCPAEFPGSYQFYFNARGLRLAVVVVEESGCREVTGLGPVRRADQPGFWRLLGHVLGGNPLMPLPGSGLLTGCEPIRGQPPRACPYQSGMPHKPWG